MSVCVGTIRTYEDSERGSARIFGLFAGPRVHTAELQYIQGNYKLVWDVVGVTCRVSGYFSFPLSSQEIFYVVRSYPVAMTRTSVAAGKLEKQTPTAVFSLSFQLATPAGLLEGDPVRTLHTVVVVKSFTFRGIRTPWGMLSVCRRQTRELLPFLG